MKADRSTRKQTDIHADRQTDTQLNIQAGSQPDRQADRLTDRQAGRCSKPDSLADSQLLMQTDKQADTVRQTDK